MAPGSTSASASSRRAALPYREKTELYLLNGSTGRVLAQDRERYVFLPGGGVDAGETDVVAAAKRELAEEVGATLDGPLTHLITVDWTWFLEWADSPTRKDRFRQFRGERVHVLVGRVKPLTASTRGNDADGDAWTGQRTLGLDECLDLMKRYAGTDHPNTYPYRVAQQMAVQHLKVLAKLTSGTGSSSRSRAAAGGAARSAAGGARAARATASRATAASAGGRARPS